jgi:hypothetical protein
MQSEWLLLALQEKGILMSLQFFPSCRLGIHLFERGISAVLLLYQHHAVPNEVGAFGVGTRPGEFVLALFGEPSAERVVGVCPDLGIAGWLFDFGADELVF